MFVNNISSIMADSSDFTQPSSPAMSDSVSASHDVHGQDDRFRDQPIDNHTSDGYNIGNLVGTSVESTQPSESCNALTASPQDDNASTSSGVSEAESSTQVTESLKNSSRASDDRLINSLPPESSGISPSPSDRSGDGVVESLRGQRVASVSLGGTDESSDNRQEAYRSFDSSDGEDESLADDTYPQDAQTAHRNHHGFNDDGHSLSVNSDEEVFLGPPAAPSYEAQSISEDEPSQDVPTAYASYSSSTFSDHRGDVEIPDSDEEAVSPPQTPLTGRLGFVPASPTASSIGRVGFAAGSPAASSNQDGRVPETDEETPSPPQTSATDSSRSAADPPAAPHRETSESFGADDETISPSWSGISDDSTSEAFTEQNSAQETRSMIHGELDVVAQSTINDSGGRQQTASKSLGGANPMKRKRKLPWEDEGHGVHDMDEQAPTVPAQHHGGPDTESARSSVEEDSSPMLTDGGTAVVRIPSILLETR